MTRIKETSRPLNMPERAEGASSEPSPKPSAPKDEFSIRSVMNRLLLATAPLSGPMPQMPPPAPATTVNIDQAQVETVDDATYQGLMPIGATTNTLPTSSIEALRLIRNGEVHISVPLEAGSFPGGVTVKPNTTMSFHLKIEEGNIDFKTADVRLSQPVVGPMGTSIEGVDLNRRGKFKVDVNWLPDPRIGRRMPSNLADFVQALGDSDALPVKMLGIRVANIPMGSTGRPVTVPTSDAAKAQATSPRSSQPAVSKPSPSPASAVQNPLRLNEAKMTNSHVELAPGTLNLGNGNYVRLGPSNAFTLSGTLSDLQLEGRISIDDMALQNRNMNVRGSGNGNLSLRWNAPLGRDGGVTAELSHLQLNATNTRVQLPDESHIRLAEGTLRDASFTVHQALQPNGQAWQPKGLPEVRAAEMLFDGVVDQGRLTVPHRDSVHVIQLHRARLSEGYVSMRPGHTVVNGKLSELTASFEQGGTRFGHHTLYLGQINVEGSGDISFDSKEGARLSGNIGMDVLFNGGTFDDGQVQASVKPGSQVDLLAQQVEYRPETGLQLTGQATSLNLGMTDVQVKTPTVFIEGGSARISGSANEIQLSAHKEGGSIALGQNSISVDMATANARMNLRDGQFVDFSTGAGFQTAVRQATFDSNGTARVGLANTRVNAPIDSCFIRLKNGKSLQLKNPAISMRFNELDLQSGAKSQPVAQGDMSLKADLDASELDVAALLNSPGFQLQNIQGDTWRVNFDMGAFRVFPNGDFKATDLSVGVQVRAEALEAHIGPKK